MRVHVHYTTQIKSALGVTQETVELPAQAGVPDLLRILAERYQEPFHRLVFTVEGNLLPSILLCVGDRQVDPHDADPLLDGATVTFLSAISGG
jgi:molybdopterin converting factor small subunit